MLLRLVHFSLLQLMHSMMCVIPPCCTVGCCCPCKIVLSVVLRVVLRVVGSSSLCNWIPKNSMIVLFFHDKLLLVTGIVTFDIDILLNLRGRRMVGAVVIVAIVAIVVIVVGVPDIVVAGIVSCYSCRRKHCHRMISSRVSAVECCSLLSSCYSCCIQMCCPIRRTLRTFRNFFPTCLIQSFFQTHQ